jgi:hypothetical protein
MSCTRARVQLVREANRVGRLRPERVRARPVQPTPTSEPVFAGEPFGSVA